MFWRGEGALVLKKYPAIVHPTRLRKFSELKKACYMEKEYHACICPEIKLKFLVHERAEKKNYTYTESHPPPLPLKSQMVHLLGLTFFLEIC